MKTIAKLGLTTLVIIALLFSCKKADYASSEETTDYKISADSTAVSSSAAVEKKTVSRNLSELPILNLRLKTSSSQLMQLKMPLKNLEVLLLTPIYKATFIIRLRPKSVRTAP